MFLDKRNILKPTPGLYLIPIKSYKQKRTLTSWHHYLTSTDLFVGHICKFAPRSSTVAINSSLIEHVSERFAQLWLPSRYLRYLNFSPLAYRRARNWPDRRSPTYKIRDIQVVGMHLVLYQIMKVSNISLNHCGGDATGNFRRWGHLTWPGDLIFGDLDLKFSGNLWNSCPNRHRRF